MKSKILLCLVLASCSTMFAKENKVKDRYTDVVKSTEIKDDIDIRRDDIYVCDYRYDDSKEKGIYFRYCDKDGKPLNNTVELEKGEYEFRDGFIYYRELKGKNGVVTQQINNPKYSDTIVPYFEELRIYKNGKLSVDKYLKSGTSVNREFCSDGRINSESIKASFYSADIYNEVKKDGVKLNTPLIVETIDESKLDEKTGVKTDRNNIHLVNGKQVTDGFFEISDCYGNITSYTLKNGKYEGDYVKDGPIKDIKKYENGKLKSEVFDYKDDKKILGDDGEYYDTLEIIFDDGKYIFRYYNSDKLVKEDK